MVVDLLQCNLSNQLYILRGYIEVSQQHKGILFIMKNNAINTFSSVWSNKF